MNISGKYELKWFEFRENFSSNLQDLQYDEDFMDVTLVGKGSHQIKAHKIILATVSSFFSNILKQNKNPHPLIYMRGVKSDLLLAIIEFIYKGETAVNAEDLDDFLAFSDELEIKGLESRNDILNTKHKPKEEFAWQVPLSNLRGEDVPICPIGTSNKIPNMSLEIMEVKEEHAKDNERSDLEKEPFHIDAAIDEVMKLTLKRVKGNYGQDNSKWICKICNKIDKKKSNLKYHISTHIKRGDVAIKPDLIRNATEVSHIKVEMNEDEKIIELQPTDIYFEKPIPKKGISLEETAIDMMRAESIMKKVRGKYGQGDGRWICTVCNKMHKKKFHIKRHAMTHMKKEAVVINAKVEGM